MNASAGRDGHCGLNPARNSTFEFVDRLVEELAASITLANGSETAPLFPERFFHFGGCVILRTGACPSESVCTDDVRVRASPW